MYRPKLFFALSIITTLITGNAFAQDTVKKSSIKLLPPPVFEQEPLFPGGLTAFSKFVTNNLQYPEVAKLIGLTGKVYVSFAIDKDGSVTDVKPIKCMGAGCESEAERVVSMSPKWSPGFLKGEPVKVKFVVPVSFNFEDDNTKTTMKSLRKSNYGFVFFINNKTYTLNEAEAILGKSFNPITVNTVETYNDPKYAMPDKKAVYLVVMKNS
ncbi:MAG TPA: TonB family protein [Mucilaginibacter sp.]|nr:TonB family protein [Mucilaginibacter sp.]